MFWFLYKYIEACLSQGITKKQILLTLTMMKDDTDKKNLALKIAFPWIITTPLKEDFSNIPFF